MLVETPENVLALTASVRRGGSNRDSVGEGDITEGDALRGVAPLQSSSSPRVPLLPGSRARASRAVLYASWTAENVALAPDENRSHTERTPPPVEPNRSVVVERAGRGPGVSGLGTRAGECAGASAGEEAGDGEGRWCGNDACGGTETVVSGNPGSSWGCSTMDSADGGACVAT